MTEVKTRQSACVWRTATRLLLCAFVPVVAVTAVLAGEARGGSVSPFVAPPTPVVSLAFDDGIASQLVAADILHAAGLHGVFYINTGLLGAKGHMAMSDVQRLAAAGDEIGGHTLDHPHLDQLTEGDVWREICSDRQALVNADVDPVGFAYPYGEPGEYGAAAVQACGYQYGRLAGGLAPEASCEGCLPSEPLGPEKPDALRAWVPTSAVSLDELEAAVTGAEGSFGLLTIVFHNVCASACSAWSIAPQMLRDFVSWLSAEQRSARLLVATPEAALNLRPSAAEGPNVLVNPSFLAHAGTWRCWRRKDSASVASASSNHVSVRSTVEGHTGRGALVIVPVTADPLQAELDGSTTSACVLPLRRSSVDAGVWYRSTAIVRVAVNIRENGSWRRWLLSPAFAPSTSWTYVTVSTPLLPSGADAATIGLVVSSPGAAIFDDASLRVQTDVALRTTVFGS